MSEPMDPREQMRKLILQTIEDWFVKRAAEALSFLAEELADEILEGIAWPVESD